MIVSFNIITCISSAGNIYNGLTLLLIVSNKTTETSAIPPSNLKTKQATAVSVNEIHY